MPLPKVTINQRQLTVELTASDPILKRVAEEVMREAFFDPAVAAMKAEWQNHPVTQEIAAGVGGANISNTLDAPFREKGDKGDTPANLWGFIGFDKDPATELAPILQRLDPNHPEGPKLTYVSRDKAKLVYQFAVTAPSEDAIWEATSMPWAEGISWVKRVEQGIPGIGHFLNVANRPTSRSGGGIQVEGQVRSGRFKPTSYMSRILNDFLRRAAGRAPNGRKVG